MSDVRAVELAKHELDDLIATGEKLIALAGNAGDNIEGGQLADVMAWVSRSGHIIRKVAGQNSAYDHTFQEARRVQGFTNIHGNNYDHLCAIWGALKGLRHALVAAVVITVTGFAVHRRVERLIDALEDM